MVVGGSERPRNYLGARHRLRSSPKALGQISQQDFLGFPFGWCSPPAFSLSSGDRQPKGPGNGVRGWGSFISFSKCPLDTYDVPGLGCAKGTGGAFGVTSMSSQICAMDFRAIKDNIEYLK